MHILVAGPRVGKGSGALAVGGDGPAEQGIWAEASIISFSISLKSNVAIPVVMLQDLVVTKRKLVRQITIVPM